ncbi:MAG: alpha/beta hydrolase [Pseudomonadota bacterium]|nr:alpha/beta hydrolase [Pseudomonadota bacterium]
MSAWLNPLIRSMFTAVSVLPESWQRRLAGDWPQVDGQRLHTEVALALRLMNAMPLPSFETLPLSKARRNLDAEAALFGGSTPLPRVEDVSIPAPWGAMPARRYEPHAQQPGKALLVYFHGGGFVLGGLASCDSVCRFIAKHTGVTVLSVDYRLAPEHPFPAATEDALTAYSFAADVAASWGMGADRLMMGGDSAGGNLCLSAALQVRDHNRQAAQTGAMPLPRPMLLVPFFPWVDFVGTHRSHQLFAHGYFLTQAQLAWYTEHYLPNLADRADPRASLLLHPDLSDIGACYFGIAGFDPLRDECLLMAERCQQAGNPVQVDVDSGHVHAYVNATGVGKTGAAALRRACDAMVARL